MCINIYGWFKNVKMQHVLRMQVSNMYNPGMHEENVENKMHILSLTALVLK